MRNRLKLLMTITEFCGLSKQNTPHNCIVEGNVNDEYLIPV